MEKLVETWLQITMQSKNLYETIDLRLLYSKVCFIAYEYVHMHS